LLNYFLSLSLSRQRLICPLSLGLFLIVDGFVDIYMALAVIPGNGSDNATVLLFRGQNHARKGGGIYSSNASRSFAAEKETLPTIRKVRF